MGDQKFSGIVERIHSGSEDAFGELYTAVSGRVFSYIIPRVGSRDEALDILQEVFLGVWSSRHRFDYRNDASVYGFIFTIARRTLAKHYGSRAKDKAIEELTQDDRYDMDTNALGDTHTVERALIELSEDDRDLVTLRYWSGLSFGEIAEIHGKTENAVRVKHHRALEKLKVALTKYGS